ncbi:hypothetical protein F5Y18DRAFT_383552 [Xylariaceae sp. FL1019]|nr:hypothetical protein F5Y18DRAFT_383552 [Xylariaceae sp. FL1019]
MLPRQLHRPLSPLVAVEWRLASTTARFHADTSSLRSRSNKLLDTSKLKRQQAANESRLHKERITQKTTDRLVGKISRRTGQDIDATQKYFFATPQQPTPQPAGEHPPEEHPPTQKSPSLFEQFFPDEAKSRALQTGRADQDGDSWSSYWTSQFFADQPPPRVAPIEEVFGYAPGDKEIVKDNDEYGDLHKYIMRAKSMLVLHAASKHLLLSDFIRLGVEAKHVEGWISGILTVVQARNPDTLEPQGHYWILFDQPSAAAAYKDKMEHVWRLGKTYLPGAHHKASHKTQQQLPEGLRFTEQGADVAKLLKGFTLIPPSMTYHIKEPKWNEERIMELGQGGIVDRIAERLRTKFLVMVRVDRGRLTLDTLRAAIQDDGVNRNLPWRIIDLEKGILPYGQSLVKANEAYQPSHNPDQSGEDVPEANHTDEEASEHDLQVRQYFRFIVPFMDNAEAQRFVRNWHRRELTWQIEGDKGATREESRLLNVSLLW